MHTLWGRLERLNVPPKTRIELAFFTSRLARLTTLRVREADLWQPPTIAGILGWTDAPGSWTAKLTDMARTMSPTLLVLEARGDS